MAKIRLDVDTLRVESFDTALAEAGRGTVHGRWGEPVAGNAASLHTYPGECTPISMCRSTCVDGCTDACFA